MEKIKNLFTWHSNSKISLRTLCPVAMFIALAFVLERIVPAIDTGFMRISFAFIPMMCVGMLFGPLWGAAASGVADILGWPLMGMVPIPLILFARIANGFLYGLILHREEIRILPHAVATALSTQIIGGAILTTLGLAQLFNTPFMPLLITRLPQFGIFIVLHIAVFPVLVKFRYALRKSGLAPV